MDALSHSDAAASAGADASEGPLAEPMRVYDAARAEERALEAERVRREQVQIQSLADALERFERGEPQASPARPWPLRQRAAQSDLDPGDSAT
jgi:hypothetical protein